MNPIALGIGAGAGLLQGLPSALTAIKQGKALKRLKIEDTTPAEFKERLAGSRQAAADYRMPAQGMLMNQLAQSQAAATAAATRSGASTGAVLGAITGLDANRQQGQERLAAQAEAGRQNAQLRLNQDLQTAADYRSNDLRNYRTDKAALTEAKARNWQNAISSVASGLAGGYNMSVGGKASVGDDGTRPDVLMDPRTPALNVPSLPSGGLPTTLSTLPGYGTLGDPRIGGLTGFRTRRRNGF